MAHCHMLLGPCLFYSAKLVLGVLFCIDMNDIVIPRCSTTSDCFDSISLFIFIIYFDMVLL